MLLGYPGDSDDPLTSDLANSRLPHTDFQEVFGKFTTSSHAEKFITSSEARRLLFVPRQCSPCCLCNYRLRRFVCSFGSQCSHSTYNCPTAHASCKATANASSQCIHGSRESNLPQWHSHWVWSLRGDWGIACFAAGVCISWSGTFGCFGTWPRSHEGR